MAVNWGPDSDMTTVVQALHSADPSATLHNTFGWVDGDRIDRYVAEATPLENAGDEDGLALAARRFCHDVRATQPVVTWVEPKRSRWRRLLPWLFPLSLTAMLLTAVVMSR